MIADEPALTVTKPRYPVLQGITANNAEHPPLEATVGTFIAAAVRVGAKAVAGAYAAIPKNRSASAASTGRLCVAPIRLIASTGACPPLLP